MKPQNYNRFIGKKVEICVCEDGELDVYNGMCEDFNDDRFVLSHENGLSFHKSAELRSIIIDDTK